jgi:hypothetical protein
MVSFPFSALLGFHLAVFDGKIEIAVFDGALTFCQPVISSTKSRSAFGQLDEAKECWLYWLSTSVTILSKYL